MNEATVTKMKQMNLNGMHNAFNPTIVIGVGILLIVVFLVVILLSVKKLNNLKGK